MKMILKIAAASAVLGIDLCAQDIIVSKPGAAHFVLDLSGLAISRDSGAAAVFHKTLESDFARSGWFSLVDSDGADFQVLGRVEEKGSTLRVECEARGKAGRERLLGKSYRADASDARSLAHRVSDDVVLALTGRSGMASSRIIMVGTRTGHKELYLCDADGGNLRQLTRDKTVSVSPKWGPDGDRFVYTSYVSGFPDVYLAELGSGARKCVACYPGLNACASISPDGGKVALTLSKDGNPDLFIKNINSGRLTRVTSMKHSAQASPSWSPDGRQIVFVSDSPGTPQLFIVSSSGGAPKRITFKGSENVEPDWGANGLIAYSSLVYGRYQIHVLNPDTLETRQVSSGNGDYSSPSWAPDARHIVCEGRHGHRSRIFIVDTMSDSCIRLLPEALSGEWQSPDWSAK